jgi:hypothetical protein
VTRAQFLAFAVAVSLSLLSLAVGIAWASSRTSSGDVRAVVVVVGDSNETIRASEISNALLNRPDGYALASLARPGAGIRTADCASDTAPCPTYDFWEHRITGAGHKIRPDAYVIALGINDTAYPGTTTSPGYANYGTKIDWLLHSIGSTPVYWTNLPCAIEPRDRTQGCDAVNAALAAAPGRHHNLTVVDWAAVANDHRDYLGPAGTFGAIHLTDAGATAWANVISRALDNRFPTN